MASSGRESFQLSGHEARGLSDQELSKLHADADTVSEFKQNKLEVEAKKNWDLFYKRNTTKFFKDRHWTKREFEELTNTANSCEDKTECRVMFEVGCGVGNFMFPLMEEDPNLYFYACDFSPRAVDFVKSHSAYDAERCTAFQCDITQDSISDHVPEGSVDVATMIFVLSAIHPDKMAKGVRNVARTLRSGGVLLFRDYGLYDHAMLRFAKGHKLSDCFYVRQDGTRAYYFSLEKLNSIMEEAGLRTVQSSYVQRSTVNKKEGVDVRRIFVQGKFSKWDDSNKMYDCKDSNVGTDEYTVTHKLASDLHIPDSPSQDIQKYRRSGDAEVDNVSALSQPVHLLDNDSKDMCAADHSFQGLKISGFDNKTLVDRDTPNSTSQLDSVLISGHDEVSNNSDLTSS